MANFVSMTAPQSLLFQAAFQLESPACPGAGRCSSPGTKLHFSLLGNTMKDFAEVCKDGIHCSSLHKVGEFININLWGWSGKTCCWWLYADYFWLFSSLSCASKWLPDLYIIPSAYHVPLDDTCSECQVCISCACNIVTTHSCLIGVLCWTSPW